MCIHFSTVYISRRHRPLRSYEYVAYVRTTQRVTGPRSLPHFEILPYLLSELCIRIPSSLSDPSTSVQIPGGIVRVPFLIIALIFYVIDVDWLLLIISLLSIHPSAVTHYR
jgi:hypothetical protein